MQQPTVYRGRRDQGWLVLACSVPFLMLGVASVLAPAQLVLSLVGLMCACGVFVAALGLVILRTRVAVGPGGISKAPYFPNGFSIRWEMVDVWSVADLGEEGDTFSHRAVHFSVGRRRMEVREAEVFHPGFDRFLQDIRSWVGRLETAPQGNESSA